MSDSPTYDKLTSIFSETRGHELGTSKPRPLEESEIVDLIVESLRERQNLYILVDGINECENPQSILNWLSVISHSSSTCFIHLFIASINEKDIEHAMDSLPNVTTETVRQIDIQHDVHGLVKASLESDPRLRRHSPELKEEIEWALTTGAKGMYATASAFSFSQFPFNHCD